VNMINTVIFDLDQTLLDKHESLIRFANHQYDTFSLKSYNVNREGFIDKFTELNHAVRPKEEVYGELIAFFQIESALFPSMLEDLNRNFHEFVIGYPGLVDMLHALKQAGYKIGMITNGRAFYQLSKIKSLGIEGYFDNIIISGAVGIRKPDHAIFQLALANLEASAERTVFVGDNVKADMIPSKQMGMRTVLKSKIDHNEYADVICDDLFELPSIIAKFA
jgi:putative hydrolase of the HAD superfamily